MEMNVVLAQEKLDVETGAAVEFDSVLLVADGEKIEIGVPFVNGGKVTVSTTFTTMAEILTLVASLVWPTERNTASIGTTIAVRPFTTKSA